EEFAFHVIMFVRIWCVGASFLFYAKKMNLSHLSALMGSIMYAFSHPVIYNVVGHPFFFHPMIFFLFLCLGFDKDFESYAGLLFFKCLSVPCPASYFTFGVSFAVLWLADY